MKTKRILSTLLSIIMILSVLFVPAYAQTPASDTITAYVTLGKYGEIVNDKNGTPIATAPIELSGKTDYTLDDAMKALHDAYFEGGAAAGYESATGDYGAYITKLWGDESGNFGYQVNGGTESVMGLSHPAEHGDYIDVCIYKNTYPDTESYTKFDKYIEEVYEGEALELTLHQAGYDADWNTVFSSCTEATITVNGEETDITTDTDGKATLTFDTAGEYIISAVKTKELNDQTVPAITAPVCVVTVKDPAIETIHNIAKKYSQSGIVSDGNMLWLLADLAIYEELYPESEGILTDAQKQACLDKIIQDTASATTPAAFAKAIIALRALGYDAKNVYTANREQLDIVNKLTTLVDEQAASVTNIYTLPYVIIALQQGTGYATDAQMDYLIESAISSKASWQSTAWGTDGATPMLLALAPYYGTNPDVQSALVETIPLITALQQDSGLIGNAASTGLAIAAFSALGMDADAVIKNENSLIDGLMSQSSEEHDGFKPTTNSFATEQGLRGLLAWQLFEQSTNRRIFDFAAYPMNPAYATWAQNCPVSFVVTPNDAVVTVEGATAVWENQFDLSEGTYNYSVSKSGYAKKTGSFTVTAEETSQHIAKTITVSLSEASAPSGDIRNQINVKIKVMTHQADDCDNDYTYKNDTSSFTAIVNETIKLDKGQTVFDALVLALENNDIDYVEGSYGYIASIDGIAEFDHGAKSGWMFTVNGDHKNTSCRETKLNANATVVWFYTDDYTKEKGSERYSSSNSGISTVSKTYTVTFKTNGGNSIESQSVTQNDTLTPPAVPTKAGYTFAGWFTDEALTAEYDFASKVTKSFTLYAKWTEDAPVQNPDLTENTFTDVDENDWYFDAVQYVYENNLMQGTGDGFEPDTNMTRAMLVTVLYRLENPQEHIAASGFADVESGAWYAPAVAWAAQHNIVSGISETEFKPNGAVSREQMAVIFYRYAQYKGYDTEALAELTQFTDSVEISDWALDAIRWAKTSALISGTSETTISPKNTATRAQVAAILMRFCENIAK